VTRKGDALAPPPRPARGPRRFPLFVFARVVLLGAAGILASLFAIDRAHQKAAEKARAADDARTHAQDERLLDAPTLEPEPHP
jgi:hypothetical protein